jgi:two-component system nitrogen regulation response regulator GlnG
MSTRPSVWIVDDDSAIRWVLERALRIAGMAPITFDAAEGALAALRTQVPDVLMTDICMPGHSGLDLLRMIQVTCPHLPVIVMTAYYDVGSAMSAYECGAFEYLPKPFDIHEVVDLLKRAATTGRLGRSGAALQARQQV